MIDNTQFPAPTQSPPPLYAWPRPGADAIQVTWPDFLKLTAEECERSYPGSPGRFLATYIHALAVQSIALGAESPEAHEALAEAERLREAAWVAALEDQSGYWSITEPEPDPEATGSLDGHPAGEAGPMQAWLGDPSCDDTYVN